MRLLRARVYGHRRCPACGCEEHLVLGHAHHHQTGVGFLKGARIRHEGQRVRCPLRLYRAAVVQSGGCTERRVADAGANTYNESAQSMAATTSTLLSHGRACGQTWRGALTRFGARTIASALGPMRLACSSALTSAIKSINHSTTAVSCGGRPCSNRRISSCAVATTKHQGQRARTL